MPQITIDIPSGPIFANLVKTANNAGFQGPDSVQDFLLDTIRKLYINSRWVQETREHSESLEAVLEQARSDAANIRKPV